MLVERNHNGHWVISEIIGNESVQRVYIGYNTAEAKELFILDTKGMR